MPRRREVPKREILPDPKHHSQLVAKFMNVVMKHGKKSVAERIVYGALALLHEKVKKVKKQHDDSQEAAAKLAAITPVDCFTTALENVRFTVEVRSKRLGGATYQVPVEVSHARSIALGMRNLVESARSRAEHGMIHQLAGELFDAFEGKGASFKKREDMYRMAKANQAFAHLIRHSS